MLIEDLVERYELIVSKILVFLFFFMSICTVDETLKLREI